jgi:hypothetical protein
MERDHLLDAVDKVLFKDLSLGLDALHQLAQDQDHPRATIQQLAQPDHSSRISFSEPLIDRFVKDGLLDGK